MCVCVRANTSLLFPFSKLITECRGVPLPRWPRLKCCRSRFLPLPLLLSLTWLPPPLWNSLFLFALRRLPPIDFSCIPFLISLFLFFSSFLYFLPIFFLLMFHFPCNFALSLLLVSFSPLFFHFLFFFFSFPSPHNALLFSPLCLHLTSVSFSSLCLFLSLSFSPILTRSLSFCRLSTFSLSFLSLFFFNFSFISLLPPHPPCACTPSHFVSLFPLRLLIS